jgi:hypothetical protein
MDFSFFTTDNKSGYKTKEKWFHKNHANEYDKIINYCKPFHLKTFKEKIWFYFHNLKEIPKCSCGKESTFSNRFDRGYQSFCSLECANENKEELLKRQIQTNQKKWGVDFYTQHQDFVVKQKLTKKEKSAVSKKAHKGEDIGKKGKGFEKVAKAAGGGEKGEKIAAAAMWKGIAKKKAKSLKEEVEALFEETEDLLSLIQDYIDYDYTADQGGGDSVEHAEESMKQIKAKILKLKGEQYFEAVKDYASLKTYDEEYAGPEESAEIQPQLEELASKLGFTVDQIEG